MRFRRLLREAHRPTLRGTARHIARRMGPRPRSLAARGLMRLPAGSHGGRQAAWLAGIRVAALATLGHEADAHQFAIERGANPGARPRLAMATWLADHGEPRDALNIVAEPLPSGERQPLRRNWQLLHARTARTLGRYAEARAALDQVIDEGPEDAEAIAEQRRLDQIVERYAVVPAITRTMPPGMKRKPGRVLHLVEASLGDNQSGYTIRTHQVATAQRLAGLEPTVLVVGSKPPDGVLSRRIDDVDYRWLRGAVGMRRFSRTSWTELANLVADVVIELEPAVVHAATPPTVGNLGRAVARWSGLPLVYEVRGFRDEFWRISHDEDENVDHARLSRRADSESMREAAAVVTLGQQMKAEVVSRGAAAANVSIVPNAVDTALFRPGPRNQALAEQYGIGRDEVVVGYISSFQPYEDFATLVDAIAILRARGRRVRGLLVGDGSTRPDILRQVAELDLEGVVAMPGRIPHADVPRHHRLIDVFVVPRVASRLSQLVTPLKPLEAMASGRALVVSRLDALTETITDGQTGMTFDPGSATDLASVLERLVLDPGERHRLGDAARSWVERERTLARNGQRYREIYARLGVPLG